MAQPILVIPFSKVLSRVRATTLVSRLGYDSGRLGCLKQIL
jgi:hypothetical protein